MSWQEYLPSDRVRWINGTDPYPVWPSEPDTSIIRILVATTLRADERDITVGAPIDFSDHKAYEITVSKRSSPETSYILRVDFPMVPTHGLESEVATLTYLNGRTVIPAPKVVAWDSYSDNDLGYEWVLFEKIAGIKLSEVWHTFSCIQKIETIESLARYLAQLWTPEARFPGIGSLYFSDFNDNGCHVRLNPSTPDGDPDEFNIGRIVDPSFSFRRRRYIPSDPGPYLSETEWLSAKLRIEQSVLETAKALFETRDDMPAEYESEIWIDLENEIGVGDCSAFLDDYDSIIDTCDQYREILPSVCPADQTGTSNEDHEQSSFVLHHSDLRLSDILVDEFTYSITGIINWGGSMTIPAWIAMNYPAFIDEEEPLNGNLPPVPTAAQYRAHSQGPAVPGVAEYEQWIAKELRCRFDCKMADLGFGTDWWPGTDEDWVRREFIEGVLSLTTNKQNAVARLESVRRILGH